MKFKESLDRYEKAQAYRKNVIRKEPNRWKRFWMWVWFLIAWPFRWIWVECRDWRTLALFVAVMAVIGSEVWVPLVISIFAPPVGLSREMWISFFQGKASAENSGLKGSMFFVACTCEAFWLLPGTPFIPLCIFVTMGIKTAIDKARERKERKDERKNTEHHDD